MNLSIESNLVTTRQWADKAARVSEVLEGPRDPQRLPIQLIVPTSGRMIWLLDSAAAGM